MFISICLAAGVCGGRPVDPTTCLKKCSAFFKNRNRIKASAPILGKQLFAEGGGWDDPGDEKMLIHKWFFCVAIVLVLGLFVPTRGYAEQDTSPKTEQFLVLEGEIMDIEGLDEPEGKLTVTVRDSLSAKVLRLSADPHRTTIQMGDRILSVRDLLSGSMGTFIYRESDQEGLPELVYIKVTGSYTS